MCPTGTAEGIAGHDVKTVAEAGWAGVKNGELLQLAANEFEVFLTIDRNLEYQQNFSGVVLAVVVIHALSNDIAALRPLMPAVLAAIPRAKPGTLTHIHG